MWVYYPSLNAWTVITGLNIAKFATCRFAGEERLYGIDANNGNVYRLFYGDSDNGAVITYTEEGRAEDFGQPLMYKQGGEFKIRARGTSASISPFASCDDRGYETMDGSTLILPAGGLDFTFDFPFSFGSSELQGVWHLDRLGKFKTIKFKIYSSTLNASLKIMESLAVTFKEEYQSEDV
jgi:hypothetical protein